MVTLLVSPGCSSSRRAKEWLIEHGINFKERNMFIERLSIYELKLIIQKTETGIDEIISKRSVAFRAVKNDYDALSLRDIIKKMSKNPEMIRSPILFDNKRLIVGFSEDQIRCFTPRRERTLFLRNAILALNS